MTTWLFTPAFCKTKMLEQGLEYLYSQCPPVGMKHVIIDQHYPVFKTTTHFQVQYFAHKYGCTYLDFGMDLGMQLALNKAMKEVGVDRNDLILTWDLDDRPVTGTFEALTEVIQQDPSLAVSAVTLKRVNEKIRRCSTWKKVGNQNVWVHPDCEMWNVAAYRTSFIFEIGGFGQTNQYWGGLEAYLYSKWTTRFMKLGYLCDYHCENVPVDLNDPTLIDPEYVQYKILHDKGYPNSFETWLRENHSAKLIE